MPSSTSTDRGRFLEGSVLLEAPAPHREDKGAFLRLEFSEDLVGIIAFQENTSFRVEAAHIGDEGQVESAREI